MSGYRPTSIARECELSLNLLNANLNFFDLMISIYGSSLVSSLKIQYESSLVDVFIDTIRS